MRARRPLAIVVALLVAATACGGGGDASDAVRKAPGKTVAANTAQVALSVSFANGAAGSGAVTGDGVVDLKNGRGALTLDVSGAGSPVATGGPGKADVVLDKSGIYVKLPQAPAPGSKPWIKLDLASLAAQSGANIGSLGELNSADPTQALTFLEGAASDTRKVGEDKLRGASTTHYRGTLDLQKASSQVSADARPAVDQAIKSLGTSSLPTDVWLDDQGRMRKMVFSMDADGAGPNPANIVEFEMYNFGTEANVTVPPPDQVTNLGSLLQGGPR